MDPVDHWPLADVGLVVTLFESAGKILTGLGTLQPYKQVYG